MTGSDRLTDLKTRARFDSRARIIKAMAHPSRLFIVDRLSRGECCVCDLRDLVGADLSTVSKHLSILKSAGIVVDEKRGTAVFYKLRLACVLKFFGCVETIMHSNVKEQMGLLTR